jgi:hypothetical protein
LALGLPAAALAEAPGPATDLTGEVRTEISGASLQPLEGPAVLRLGPADADWSDIGLPIALPLSSRMASGARTARGADDATCLTQAVYYEARSEGVVGEQAVAQVVMNRTHDPRFPGSVCGVVYQRASGDRGTCQFTFACDGSMNRLINPTAWSTAQSVAKQALGGFVYEPIRDATHYHADYVQPAWSFELPRIRQIGRHIFYR